MSRPRKVARSATLMALSVSDFGPEIRLTAAAANPGRVVVKEFRSDPTLPGGGLVRGARVRDPLLKMYEAGFITKRQWDAVQALRDDIALAGGAKIGLPEECGIRSQPSNRNWPSDAQLDAMRRVTVTFSIFGDVERRLVNWTVIQLHSLLEFSRVESMRDQTARTMLQDVLNKLADRYESRTYRA